MKEGKAHVLCCPGAKKLELVCFSYFTCMGASSSEMSGTEVVSMMMMGSSYPSLMGGFYSAF